MLNFLLTLNLIFNYNDYRPGLLIPTTLRPIGDSSELQWIMIDRVNPTPVCVIVTDKWPESPGRIR